MTIDRDKVWTGELNRLALDPQPHATVGLYDTTLRDGEQTVGVVLSPEDKLEIARALDALGIDRIEAGFPRVSDDDFRAVRLIAGAGLRAEVWGFSRAVQADVDAAFRAGARAYAVSLIAMAGALGQHHLVIRERERDFRRGRRSGRRRLLARPAACRRRRAFRDLCGRSSRRRQQWHEPGEPG